MGWAEASGSIASYSSPVESGILAPHVAHVWVGSTAARDEPALSNAIRKVAIADVLFVRFDSAQSWVGAVLAASDRVLVPAGSVLYWRDQTSRDLPAMARSAAAEAVGLSLLGPSDAFACGQAMATIFRGYTNHYAVNPWLTPIDAGAAYADWAIRSLESEDRFVLAQTTTGGGIQAIALLQVSGDTAEVLLAGVDPTSRGRGTYSAFIVLVSEACTRLGLKNVMISTQDHNVAVQRLWCRCGFEPVLGVTIVHAVARTYTAATSARRAT